MTKTDTAGTQEALRPGQNNLTANSHTAAQAIHVPPPKFGSAEGVVPHIVSSPLETTGAVSASGTVPVGPGHKVGRREALAFLYDAAGWVRDTAPPRKRLGDLPAGARFRTLQTERSGRKIHHTPGGEGSIVLFDDGAKMKNVHNAVIVEVL